MISRDEVDFPRALEYYEKSLEVRREMQALGDDGKAQAKYKSMNTYIFSLT